jgi:transcriptional regulator with XRE-family HTH domain
VRTRIRHYRKMRRMTQTDLARQVGTTAATISRLETADMTVSMDWLQKFAGVFHVRIADLIDEPKKNRVPCVGQLGRKGAFDPALAAGEESVTLEAPAHDPIALRVRENLGNYCAGDVLIADRLPAEYADRALGRDCIVEVDGEAGGFGRFISSADGHYLLVPPEPGAQARPLPTPGWIAPVVMLIRYL